jgi:hypothetical protein
LAKKGEALEVKLTQEELCVIRYFAEAFFYSSKATAERKELMKAISGNFLFFHSPKSKRTYREYKLMQDLIKAKNYSRKGSKQHHFRFIHNHLLSFWLLFGS